MKRKKLKVLPFGTSANGKTHRTSSKDVKNDKKATNKNKKNSEDSDSLKNKIQEQFKKSDNKGTLAKAIGLGLLGLALLAYGVHQSSKEEKETKSKKRTKKNEHKNL